MDCLRTFLLVSVCAFLLVGCGKKKPKNDKGNTNTGTQPVKVVPVEPVKVPSMPPPRALAKASGGEAQQTALGKYLVNPNHFDDWEHIWVVPASEGLLTWPSTGHKSSEVVWSYDVYYGLYWGHFAPELIRHTVTKYRTALPPATRGAMDDFAEFDDKENKVRSAMYPISVRSRTFMRVVEVYKKKNSGFAYVAGPYEGDVRKTMSKVSLPFIADYLKNLGLQSIPDNGLVPHAHEADAKPAAKGGGPYGILFTGTRAYKATGADACLTEKRIFFLKPGKARELLADLNSKGDADIAVLEDNGSIVRAYSVADGISKKDGAKVTKALLLALQPQATKGSAKHTRWVRTFLKGVEVEPEALREYIKGMPISAIVDSAPSPPEE